jgi:CheY-like chemotaxis protein
MDILSQVSDFDLVLTDMQMPEMDGIQIAQQINLHYKRLPIVLLSSVGDERSKEYQDLFASVLTKPVKQNTLFKRIITLLNGHQHNSLSESTTHLEKKLSTKFSQQHPLTILIAEDNPVNQRLTERVLSKLGYEATQVFNGQEALEALTEKRFDVILMDIQMPVMDGLESTKKIRLLKQHQPIIIAMTANAMQGDREICLKAGMDDYISKPIKLDEIIMILEKWAYVTQDRQ